MPGNPHLYKVNEPAPEPPVAEVLRLWEEGFDTQQIARALFVRESVIYNMLARLSR